MGPLAVHEAHVRKVVGTTTTEETDLVAIEAPLAIRLAYVEDGVRVERTLSITMRTPGEDRDLALGFACTEGVIASPGDVTGIAEGEDEVTLTLRDASKVDLARLDRSGLTTSACGACGKTSFEALRAPAPFPIASGPTIAASVVHALPAALRAAQANFDRTGGIHAAALFDATGAPRVLREDVGRHNAVDKLIGAMLAEGALPLASYVLMVSGRASFELVQKARMAGIPILAAVGAPSSLAIDLAREAGMTVLGFVRDGRFNVYSGSERIAGSLRR